MLCPSFVKRCPSSVKRQALFGGGKAIILSLLFYKIKPLIMHAVNLIFGIWWNFVPFRGISIRFMPAHTISNPKMLYRCNHEHCGQNFKSDKYETDSSLISFIHRREFEEKK
jgi:hypothetical protein